MQKLRINMALRIKELCKEKHITMAEIAEKIGINPITLSQSLNGNPTLNRLTEVANALGVDVSELFEQPVNNNLHGVLYLNGTPVIVNCKQEIEDLLEKVSE